jgi:hypothetical protein
MPTSGEVVRKAIDDWTCGAGYITSIFSPDMTSEIVGHSVALCKVLHREGVP